MDIGETIPQIEKFGFGKNEMFEVWKNRMIATVMLTRTVRSELAAFASEVL